MVICTDLIEVKRVVVNSDRIHLHTYRTSPRSGQRVSRGLEKVELERRGTGYVNPLSQLIIPV